MPGTHTQGDQQVGSGSPPPDGKAGPAGSSWLDRTSLEAKLSAALCAVPEYIRTMVEAASSTWKMEPSVLLVTALHQLAAAGGRLHRLRHHHMGMCCPFSVLTVSSHSTRAQFVEYLGEPWLYYVRRALREHQELGPRHINREIEKLYRMLEDPSAAKGLDCREINDEIYKLRHLSKPSLVLQTVSPARMMRAVNTSHDRVVMSLDGSTDPVEELLRGSRKQVAELCRLLIMGWEDVDLPDRGPVPMRGMAHLFWRTNMAAARRLILDRQSMWRQTPPPVLLVRQHFSPEFLEALPSEAVKGWEAMLTVCYMRRFNPTHIVFWKLSDEAKKTWGAFHQELLSDAGVFAPFPPQWFRWLPELMVRLALLFSVLHRFGQKQPPPEGVVEADAIYKACTVTWWLAHEHLECLRALHRFHPVHEVPETDDFTGIDTIDDQATAEAILGKLLEKGPLLRRELTRSFHTLPAQDRDRVVSRLIRERLVRKTEDGRLQLVPLPDLDNALR